MDGMTNNTMATAELHRHATQNAIRPEIHEVFRQGRWNDDSDRRRRNYQDAFDRLIGFFGQSPEMVVVSWRIASNLALLIGDRDPKGWRWEGNTFDDPALERAVCEFENFERLFFTSARKFLLVATQMRDCLPVDDEELTELISALQPFACPRARAADPRSKWHETARLLASRIEAGFQTLESEPPKRSSACSPLILIVQDLLSMLGLHVEAEAIRKVLSHPVR